MTSSENPLIGGGPFQIKLLSTQLANPGHGHVRGCPSGTRAAPSRPQA